MSIQIHVKYSERSFVIHVCSITNSWGLMGITELFSFLGFISVFAYLQVKSLLLKYFSRLDLKYFCNSSFAIVFMLTIQFLFLLYMDILSVTLSQGDCYPSNMTIWSTYSLDSKQHMISKSSKRPDTILSP